MLFNNWKQQLPVDSLRSIPIDLSNALVRRDEFSEIVTNMANSLHMNTPEQTIHNINIHDLNDDDDHDDDDDDDYQRQELIEQLKTQLIQNQMKRNQTRNYTQILNQSNTPAQWYKTPSSNRSVYFYDPYYQNSLQQRTNSPPKIPSNISSNSSHSIQNRTRFYPAHNNCFSITPRTKYMLDLYNTAVSYHRQKQHLQINQHAISSNTSQKNIPKSSKIQSISVLPPINMTKHRKRS